MQLIQKYLNTFGSVQAGQLLKRSVPIQNQHGQEKTNLQANKIRQLESLNKPNKKVKKTQELTPQQKLQRACVYLQDYHPLTRVFKIHPIKNNGQYEQKKQQTVSFEVMKGSYIIKVVYVYNQVQVEAVSRIDSSFILKGFFSQQDIPQNLCRLGLTLPGQIFTQMSKNREKIEVDPLFHLKIEVTVDYKGKEATKKFRIPLDKHTLTFEEKYHKKMEVLEEENRKIRKQMAQLYSQHQREVNLWKEKFQSQLNVYKQCLMELNQFKKIDMEDLEAKGVLDLDGVIEVSDKEKYRPVVNLDEEFRTVQNLRKRNNNLARVEMKLRQVGLLVDLDELSLRKNYEKELKNKNYLKLVKTLQKVGLEAEDQTFSLVSKLVDFIVDQDKKHQATEIIQILSENQQKAKEKNEKQPDEDCKLVGVFNTHQGNQQADRLQSTEKPKSLDLIYPRGQKVFLEDRQELSKDKEQEMLKKKPKQKVSHFIEDNTLKNKAVAQLKQFLFGRESPEQQEVQLLAAVENLSDDPSAKKKLNTTNQNKQNIKKMVLEKQVLENNLDKKKTSKKNEDITTSKEERQNISSVSEVQVVDDFEVQEVDNKPSINVVDKEKLSLTVKKSNKYNSEVRQLVNSSSAKKDMQEKLGQMNPSDQVQQIQQLERQFSGGTEVEQITEEIDLTNTLKSPKKGERRVQKDMYHHKPSQKFKQFQENFKKPQLSKSVIIEEIDDVKISRICPAKLQKIKPLIPKLHHNYKQTNPAITLEEHGQLLDADSLPHSMPRQPKFHQTQLYQERKKLWEEFADNMETNDLRILLRQPDFGKVQKVYKMAAQLGTMAFMELFYNVRVLDLTNNNITYIQGLQHLKKLERLDLSQNLITRIENLEVQGHMRELHLRDNKLERIENIFHMKKLDTLSIQGNFLQEINEQIGELGALRYLYLNKNKIKKLSLCLKKLRLLAIRLDQNGMNYGESRNKEIIEYLRSTHCTVYLDRLGE